MHQIERGIYYEDSFLGVTLGGLVFSHGTIMLDSPLRPEDARIWRSSLLNQRGGANRLLVNLDAHPDRTLGDRALDSTIVTQERTAQIFRNRPTIFKGQSMESGAVWETYSDAIGMRWAIPDITFTDQMTFYWGGPQIILEHHPGPAPGSTWVIIPDARVIFVGDTVVKDQPPFLAQDDIPEWIEALELLQKEYADYVIVSGRGGLVPAETVHAQREMLETIHNRLEKLAQTNAPAEATEELIPDFMPQVRISGERQTMFYNRLRFGLYHYFSRRYRSAAPVEETHIEEEED